MRDKVIHDYFGVNLEIVWAVVVKELPKLAEAIRASLEKQAAAEILAAPQLRMTSRGRPQVGTSPFSKRYLWGRSLRAVEGERLTPDREQTLC
jgi:hypothetical protein